MIERCRRCPHHFYTGETIRCYLSPKPDTDDPTLAENYRVCISITCGECENARDRYKEKYHRQPPLLKTHLHLCNARNPHIKPYYTVEEVK